MPDILTAVRAGSSTITPFVRVWSLDGGVIGKCLDSGAQGIILPLCNTAAEAEQFVKFCMYPQRGNRSSGPVRGTTDRLAYAKIANNEVSLERKKKKKKFLYFQR